MLIAGKSKQVIKSKVICDFCGYKIRKRMVRINVVKQGVGLRGHRCWDTVRFTKHLHPKCFIYSKRYQRREICREPSYL